MSEPAKTAIVPAGRYWAKVNGNWHPLLAHAADVAAVTARLLSDDSPLAGRLARLTGVDRLDEASRARLVYLAAWHDAGKVNHGFQTKILPPGQRGRWPASGHARVTLDSLYRGAPLTELLCAEMFPNLHADLGQAAALLAVGIAHHGRPWPLTTPPQPSLGRLWQPGPDGREPLAQLRRLDGHARRWSGLDTVGGGAGLNVTPEATHLLAGLITLADWIGSSREFFPFAPEADRDPDAYWPHAQQRAARACAAVGVVPATSVVALDGEALLTRLTGGRIGAGGFAPTPLQAHVAAMPLPPPGARLLIESETGSGKTEAALALYARLRAAGLVGGLYFALPTRATAQAIYDRVKATLPGIYDGAERPTTALAVGGEAPLTEAPSPPLEEPTDSPEDGERETHDWATRHHKARLAAEIVVGTIDQALFGALPVKHAHLRLAALSRHLLVVDELHSFDRYMAVLLEHLVRFHTSAGGLALFMSATLSAVERRRFGGGPDLGWADALALPYPCYAESRGDRWHEVPCPASGRPKNVAWATSGLDEALAAAANAAAGGARVLLLRNTVDAARQAVERLAERGAGDLLWSPTGGARRPPYHARYTRPDRQTLDAAVLARFGPDAAAIAGGVILVGTQVTEQSLDVDFDLLVTDLCPVDVLLQRLGRVHRHAPRDAHRPASWREVAQAVVIVPDQPIVAFLAGRRKSFKPGWGENQPYPDLRDAELTARLIADRPTITVPADNRKAIEAVYHPERIEALCAEPGWREYAPEADLCDARGRFAAKALRLKYDQPYHACATDFDNLLELKLRTRLGDDTIRLELPAPVPAWYGGEAVESVELPTWALGLKADQTVPPARARPPRDGGPCFAVGERVIWYAPDGWHWEDS